MSQIFSNERLIDYFFVFDVDVKGIDTGENTEVLDKLGQTIDKTDQVSLKVNYSYQTIRMLPKKVYKENSMYDMNLESIFQMMPREQVYIQKPRDQYFSLIFTNVDGRYYYGFFLKIFMELPKEHPIYKETKDLTQMDLSIYSPKYLCFVSLHPFFISFKFLLEEIYKQSTVNNSRCFKVENILNTLLYRMYLPKYQTTQLSFALNDKVYTFSKTPFRSEISFRLMFTYISIENIVMLMIAFMMNSIIVFIHSNIEILAPILHSFMQLMFPIPLSHSLINNLTPNFVEYLGCFSGLIAGVFRNDFSDLTDVIRGNHSNYVYVDIDENVIIIDNNEYLKENDKIPIQRINKLIDELYKYADIYPKDVNKFNEIKNLSVWDLFQSDNIYSLSEYEDFKKMKNKSESINIGVGKGIKSFDPRKASGDPTGVGAQLSDIKIRCLFFDFFLSLFESYDEETHYTINEISQDKTFNTAKFIQDSAPDLRTFLEFLKDIPSFDILIQNINYIVDIRHKKEIKKKDAKFINLEIGLNPMINEKSLVEDFDPTYEMIISGLKRKKKNKSLDKLFKIKIYNTITISSPPYEKLSYNQRNIFVDPLHEEIFKHKSALSLYKENLDFNFLNFKFEEQHAFTKNILREEFIYLHNKDKDIKFTNIRKTLDEATKIKEIFHIINNELKHINFNPPTVEFKNFILSYGDILRRFYGMLTTKNKNYLRSLEQKAQFESPNPNVNNSLHVENTQKSFIANGTGANPNIGKSSSKSNYITSKEEYIKSFNYLIKNLQIKGEFHMNFGINLIQSVSFCEYCSKPNNIWDIRKEFVFSKSRKETRTKCKFCLQYFTPFFFVLEEGLEKDSKRRGHKKKTLNRSFEEKLKDATISKKDLISNKNTIDENKILKRVEYMSLEHIMAAYYDFENEEKSNRIKKFPYALFYNVCLMMGEIKIMVHSDIRFETIDTFIKNYVKFNPISFSEIQLKTELPIPKSNNSDVLKIIKDTRLKAEELKKEKVKAKILKEKQLQMQRVKNDVLNIKFNLKDLIYNKTYEEFQNDIKDISLFKKSKTKETKPSPDKKNRTTRESYTSNQKKGVKIEINFSNKKNYSISKPISAFKSVSPKKKERTKSFQLSKAKYEGIKTESTVKGPTEGYILDRVSSAVGNIQLKHMCDTYKPEKTLQLKDANGIELLSSNSVDFASTKYHYKHVRSDSKKNNFLSIYDDILKNKTPSKYNLAQENLV